MQYNHVLDNKTDALFEIQRASWSEATSEKRDGPGPQGAKPGSIKNLQLSGPLQHCQRYAT